MSLFSINVDGKALIPFLERIASALERIAPEPDESVPEMKPEEAVTYADDDKLDKDALIREFGADAERLKLWMDEHPEEAEGV